MSARERIIEVLEKTDHPLTVEEIAALIGMDERNAKQIYEHLRHVAKTIRRSSSGRKALLMQPPRCRACGYVFKDLDKPWKPSKCPRCSSERIEPPRFIIKEV